MQSNEGGSLFLGEGFAFRWIVKRKSNTGVFSTLGFRLFQATFVLGSHESFDCNKINKPVGSTKILKTFC